MRKFETNARAIARLSPQQYGVTQHGDTERPGTGQFLHNKEPGIYVDVVSGEPLFALTDKYESGSGWASFTRPIDPNNVQKLQDTTHGMLRTEVRSSTLAVISVMSSPMDPVIAADCDTASTQQRCGSFAGTICRPRVTGPI